MSKSHICPMCYHLPTSQTVIDTIPYSKCNLCSTIFAVGPIDAATKTENAGADARNDTANNLIRLERMQRYGVISTALDFGCGQGQLTRLLHEKGIGAIGIDRIDNNSLENGLIFTVDAVFMVEVIEHLEDPWHWLRELHKALNTSGLLYVETTFSDSLGDSWFNSSYVDPKIGHRVIMSEKIFMSIANCLGFTLLERVNDNVFILRKT